MGSTTVHFPERLLRQIDDRVRKLGTSRNKFVIQACEEALEKTMEEWPTDVIDPLLDEADRSLLRVSVDEMERVIAQRRNSKGPVIL